MVCHLLSSFIHRLLLSKIYIVDSLLSMKTCPQAFIKACYVYTVSKLICRLEPRLVHNRSPLTICQLNKKWQMSKVHCIMWILPKLKNWLNSFIIMERPWYDAHCDKLLLMIYTVYKFRSILHIIPQLWSLVCQTWHTVCKIISSFFQILPVKMREKISWELFVNRKKGVSSMQLESQ